MLNNSFKRESVKAIGAGAAVIAGTPVAATLSIVLGVAVEALGLLGEKRTNELFDTKALEEKVIAKIKLSDDFGSFVLDIWQKHNLESSEERRRMLKKFLEEEVSKEDQFENFSKIEFIMQNANLRAIRLLDIVYSNVVRKRKRDPNDTTDWFLNLKKLTPLVQDVEGNMHEQDIEHYMNELGGYGLISIMHGRYNGPLYNETKLGFIFIEYVRS
jgi:hypothetical protein